MLRSILLQRLPQLQRVQLANDCVFFAKYQRVGRHALNTTRVRINRTYVQKVGPQRQRIHKYRLRNKCRQKHQAGAAIDLLTATDLTKKAAGSPIGKMTIKDAINALPTAYRKIKSKITNKKARTKKFIFFRQ